MSVSTTNAIAAPRVFRRSPARPFVPFGTCAIGTAITMRGDKGSSSPRDAFQAWVNQNYGGQTTRDFGETGSDKYFSHSFELDGPTALSGGFLEIEISNNGHNDSIGVGVDYPHGPRWTSRLSTAGIGLGQTGTLKLDLSNVMGSGVDLVDAVGAAGHLDVAVQDDSTVHFAEMTLCQAPFGTCAIGNAMKLRGDSGPSAPRTALQAWVNKNYKGKTTRDFGETGHDKFFTHTFHLPAGLGLVSSYLEVLVTNSHHNDTIAIGVDYPTGPKWTARLADLQVAPGQTKLVQLDLDDLPVDGTSLMQAIVDQGYLDLVIQDDSTVHHAELTLCAV